MIHGCYRRIQSRDSSVPKFATRCPSGGKLESEFHGGENQRLSKLHVSQRRITSPSVCIEACFDSFPSARVRMLTYVRVPALVHELLLSGRSIKLKLTRPPRAGEFPLSEYLRAPSSVRVSPLSAFPLLFLRPRVSAAAFPRVFDTPRGIGRSNSSRFSAPRGFSTVQNAPRRLFFFPQLDSAREKGAVVARTGVRSFFYDSLATGFFLQLLPPLSFFSLAFTRGNLRYSSRPYAIQADFFSEERSASLAVPSSVHPELDLEYPRVCDIARELRYAFSYSRYARECPRSRANFNPRV